jgi:hypothetical protein
MLVCSNFENGMILRALGSRFGSFTLADVKITAVLTVQAYLVKRNPPG